MKSRQACHLARSAVASLLATCTAAAWAQSPAPELDPRTWFEVSAQSASIRSSSRADGLFNVPAGSLVQHEDDLAQPGRSTLPGLAFGRRIGVGWRVLIDYSLSQRQADTVLQRDLQVGWSRFPAGSAVHAEVDIQMLRVLGCYSLAQSGGNEFAIGIGGMSLRLQRRIDGQAGTSGSAVQAPASADYSDIGFVPLVGALGTLDVGPALQLSARADFSLGRRDTQDLTLAARWRLTPHLSLGLGWREARGNVDTEFGIISGVEHLVMNYRIRGPQLFLRAAF